MRFAIRVRPGAGRAQVGGEHDGALVVHVRSRAVEGQATESALAAVAEALGVRRRAVTLVSATTSRTNIVDVEGAAQEKLDELLAR